MENDYLQKLPQWYNDTAQYDLVLSDDIDGLVSTAAITYATGWQVGYFYDFDNLYINDRIKDKRNKSVTRVWADIAYIGNEKTFDNHVTAASPADSINRNSINPNIFGQEKIVTNWNYYDKYVGSTALMVWSIYNLPSPQSEIGKMVLLAIDASYKGHYFPGKWHDLNRHYICDVFGFPELYDVMRRHTEKDFRRLFDQYGLNRKICAAGGTINTYLDNTWLSDILGIPITIPEDNFIRFAKFNAVKNEISYKKESLAFLDGHALTAAFTGKDKVKYSCLSFVDPIFKGIKNGDGCNEKLQQQDKQ